jgi:DNA polymerase alpha subunit A
MSSILGSMDALPTTSLSAKSLKRKPPAEYEIQASSSSSVYRRSTYDDGDASSDGPLDDGIPSGMSSGDEFMSPKKRVKTAEELTPAIRKMAHLGVGGGSDKCDPSVDSSFGDVDMNAFMEVDGSDLEDIKPKSKWKTKDISPPTKVGPDLANKPLKNAGESVSVNTDSKAQSWLSIYDSLAVATEDDLGPLAASGSVKPSKVSALEPDGSLRFYWLDYLEHQGKIYFIGKLKDKTSGVWVSCCVTVEGLQRNLFVLPREKQVEQDDEGQLCETDVVPELNDVYDDFDRVRKKMGIKVWKAKFVKRKYAFGEQDVPREEREWLKVVYGFDGNCHFPLVVSKVDSMHRTPNP